MPCACAESCTCVNTCCCNESECKCDTCKVLSACMTCGKKSCECKAKPVCEPGSAELTKPSLNSCSHVPECDNDCVSDIQQKSSATVENGKCACEPECSCSSENHCNSVTCKMYDSDAIKRCPCGVACACTETNHCQSKACQKAKGNSEDSVVDADSSKPVKAVEQLEAKIGNSSKPIVTVTEVCDEPNEEVGAGSPSTEGMDDEEISIVYAVATPAIIEAVKTAVEESGELVEKAVADGIEPASMPMVMKPVPQKTSISDDTSREETVPEINSKGCANGSETV